MSNLILEFSCRENGKTYLKKQYASYPFHICRTQYIENDPYGMSNIYIQSASGGIYENESLETNIIANSCSYSHVTTQASTIVHGMTNGKATQIININATNHSYTEYISDPLILFPESCLSTDINIYVDETSTTIIADSFLLHFLKNNDVLFNQLSCHASIFSDNNKLLARDAYIVKPKNFLNGNRKYIGMGTIFIINRKSINAKLVKILQDWIFTKTKVYGGASLLPNDCGIILKFLAPDGDTLKKTTLQSWMKIRECLVGMKPKIRRK